MSGRRQINHGKTTVSKRDAAVRIDPRSAIVRAAISNRQRHVFGALCQRVGRVCGTGIEAAGNATHRGLAGEDVR